ncbi:hypothetical protein FHT02_003354 [Sphingomonas xinjiangensis]|uniref:Transposase n=1 Tax=Sphingomonas xinjiangensis TaxID=643568 RepID=A0A840YLA7_9SPHN|nr:hypothetical protein [Sphingomonas xinjiangensis]
MRSLARAASPAKDLISPATAAKPRRAHPPDRLDRRHFNHRTGSACGRRSPEPRRCRSAGLAPRESSTGRKERLGSNSKMGPRTVARRLFIGGSSLKRQAYRHGAPVGSWLERRFQVKPPMLVPVALTDKMARMVWALLTRQEDHRALAAASTQSPAAARGVRDASGQKERIAQQAARRAQRAVNSRAGPKRGKLQRTLSKMAHHGSAHPGWTDDSIRQRASHSASSLASEGASTGAFIQGASKIIIHLIARRRTGKWRESEKEHP